MITGDQARELTRNTLRNKWLNQLESEKDDYYRRAKQLVDFIKGTYNQRVKHHASQGLSYIEYTSQEVKCLTSATIYHGLTEVLVKDLEYLGFKVTRKNDSTSNENGDYIKLVFRVDW